jgi:hypothetical protein
MEVPQILFGRRSEVKKRVDVIIRTFTKGQPLSTSAFGPLMSTDEAPSALILTNPGRYAGGDDAFHCYALLYGLMEAMMKGRAQDTHFEQAFGWSLEAPWSFVGTVGEAGTMFFLKMPREAFSKEPPPEVLRGKPEWHAPFLKAALTHWDVLTRAGVRFARGAGGQAYGFSRVSFAIYQVLAKCDVVLEAADIETPARTQAAIRTALARLDN